MSNVNKIKLSKAMSHALRHAPELYGLTLDAAGWVTVNDLLAGLRRRKGWKRVERADIEAMMAAAKKQRYELEGDRIRAFYGHSVAQKIEKVPTIPPDVLYHGTTAKAAASIRQEGLKSMRRQYVHLSADTATATIVGKRRTATPIILTIHALQAHTAGVQFYRENNGIWLAEPIAPQFIA